MIDVFIITKTFYFARFSIKNRIFLAKKIKNIYTIKEQRDHIKLFKVLSHYDRMKIKFTTPLLEVFIMKMRKQ